MPKHLKFCGAALAAAALCLSLAPSAMARQSADTAARTQADEILVIGRRSGAPMWRVTGPETTIVLVGAIGGVSKTTKWDPESLTEALRKADRVMFPQSHALTVGSPFKLIGWFAKFKAMGSLPKGQSLAAFVGEPELKRLAALEARGAARNDYLERHPLHLAMDLREKAEGKIEFGRTAAEHVQSAVKKYKLPIAVDPIARSKAKPVVKDLFASSPEEHVPCLVDAIAAAEAGPAAVQARSDAWAARRVPEVLASPADKVFSSCWPNTSSVVVSRSELLERMQGLLAEQKVTIAVLSLRSLAESGGILDGLEAAGYDIQGPAWK